MLQKLGNLLRRHPFLYRVRFVLISNFADEEFFDNEYSDRYCQKGRIPDEFFDVISLMNVEKDGTFESAKKIAFDLSHGHRRGRGLGCDSVTALKLIYDSKAGVCSDYSQVFLALCAAAGIRVREWGINKDFLSGFGHAFNEIHSTEHNKWVFIDAYRSIYAVDKDSGAPLGVTEIVDLTASKVSERIEFHYIDVDLQNEESISHSDLYLNADNIFFSMSNNYIFEQDKFLKWINILPLLLLHVLMLVSGSYQSYDVYTNCHNRKIIRRKFNTLKNSFLPGVFRQVSPVPTLVSERPKTGVRS